jgi:predicted TIM-barrel fold metal-dependent hydrolase
MPLYGVARYRDALGLIDKLVDLDMFLQLQAEHEQWLELAPLLEHAAVKLLIDHCGRPSTEGGLDHPAFQRVLDLGRTGRAAIKFSGYSKFCARQFPYEDVHPFVAALLEAFTPERSMWASDWPFLRAPERLDIGPLLKLAETLFPEPEARRKIFWTTPMRLFGFSDPA